MPGIWKYSEDARKIVENVYKFCVEEKQSGLTCKMSLERAWDRTAAKTGVSRATTQIILSKKVELPSPLIENKTNKKKYKKSTRNTAFNSSKTKKNVTLREGSNILIKQNLVYVGLELTFQRSASSISLLCVTNCATADCFKIADLDLT